jgi:type VI protein secretion system component Hcp
MAVDILMTIKGYAAESQTEIDVAKDPMLVGFKKGMFFELDDFDLSVGLEDEDAQDEDRERQNSLVALGLTAKQIKGMQGKTKRHVRKFSKWLNGEKTEKYPLDFQAFGFTRQMDKASPALFSACCNSITIDSVVMVKRKPVGGRAGSREPPAMQTYLRIEFAKILIVSVDWDVDDTVREKIKFICRGAKVRYRPQEADGTMGTEVEAGRWDPMGLLGH